MSSTHSGVNKQRSDHLLNTAKRLINEANLLAPDDVAQSTKLQEIRQLLLDLYSNHTGFSGLNSAQSDDFSESFSAPTKNHENDVYEQDANQSNYLAEQKINEVFQEYYQGWLNLTWLNESKASLMAERMVTQWRFKPEIGIFLLIDHLDEKALNQTLESLGSQLYQRCQLTIISSIPKASFSIDLRLVNQWIESKDLLSSLNYAVSTSCHDWVTLVAMGDSLAHHCLYNIADYDNLHGEKWQLIYSDEDHINDEGEYCSPLFKPDLNVDYLYSYPYIGRFCAIRKTLLQELGGYSRLGSCLNEALVFKVLQHKTESVVGHIADVLYHRAGDGADPLADVDEVEWRGIVQSHFSAINGDTVVAEGYLPKTNRVIYQHANVAPLVSVIIPTKNSPELIEPCVRTLFEVTEYENFEVIIIDNGSDNEDVFFYYDEWQKRYGSRLRIISYDLPFNFSAINNVGANEAKGDYIVLLNNDTEVIEKSWMERMLQHAQREEVGVVGARLLFPGGKIQHAGVIVGLGDSASHAGGGDDFHKPGYMGRYQVDQNFSAVTAACFMTPKALYLELGGLDESLFEVLFNDVDYCLRVVEKGYKIVWTPYATLTHKQSLSIGETSADKKVKERTARECENFWNQWRHFIKHDPAYNKNLTFHSADYVPDGCFSTSWNNDIVNRPRIFGLPQDAFGCGNYRLISPLKALADASVAEIYIGPRQDIYKGNVPSLPTQSDIIRMNPDVFYVQSVLSEEVMMLSENMRKNKDLYLVSDMDDLKTNLPEKNSNRGFLPKDIRTRMRRFLANFDLLTVSTEPLAQAYSHLVKNVTVVPNYIDIKLWGELISQRRFGEKPRVGWVGAQQHSGDLEIIIDVVKQTSNEIDWVFMGMCLDELKPHVKEIHDFEINFRDYPKKMASLNLDLAVAPLEIHPFNEAKSNLRILEYGMLGWPVVCTDIYPYQNAPVKRVNNTTSEWLAAIRERVYDLDFAAREGDQLQSWVKEHWILQNNLEQWQCSLLPNTNTPIAMSA